MSESEKWPPIPEERRKKYEDLFNNSTSFEGVPPDAVESELGSATLQRPGDVVAVLTDAM